MKYAEHVVLASPTEQKRNNVVLPENHGASVLEKFTTIGRVKRIRKDGTVAHTNWQGQEEILSDARVDLIIYCTGYKREFSFLPEALQPISNGSNGSEITNCFMYTAHKEHPNSLFFFHPSKARTPFNTMARDTHEQARLIATLASQEVFTREQLEELDETLQVWLDHLYAEWAKETLNSCSCAVQNPLFMNFLNSVVNYAPDLSTRSDIGSAAMDFVRSRMNETAYRKQNAIWHAGMELRERADAVNWNIFRFLSGNLIEGPDVDGSEYYTVAWYFQDGRKHSTFREDAIKYEDLILAGKPAQRSVLERSQSSRAEKYLVAG